MKIVRKYRQLNFDLVSLARAKYYNLLLSFLTIVAFTTVAFVFSKITTNQENVISGVGIQYIIVRYAALYSAIVCIILRVTNVLKGNSSLLYIFIGTLNICVGIIAIVLFLQGNAILSWLHQCILNILLGAIILIDVFFIDKNPLIKSNIFPNGKK